MKLLHVISSLDPRGGGPIEGVRQLNGPMRALGVDVQVATCDSADAPWIVESGLRGVQPLGPAYTRYSYASGLVPWLRKNVGQFDAVIVNGLWQYHGFAVWRALSAAQVPYFVFTHGMLDPWFKRTYPMKHLKKWLYWPWAEYRVLRDARAVIFTCEEERLLARDSFWLYKVHEAVTTYGTSDPPSNGPELAAKFLENHPQLVGKRIVLFMSRIHEKKGCDLLLAAFARLAAADRRLRLVMAGPDQTGWVASLRAQAEQLGIADRVIWPGMLQGETKWGAFYAAEVFCLPSHQENFGIVVAEALACGKPVLISNKVNIWREIASDGAGIVDDDTLDGTVRNLKRWLELDANGLEVMSKRARESFVRRFHIQRAAERLVEIIRENRH